MTEALREAAEPIRKSMSVMAPHRPGKPDLRDTMTISGARGDDKEIAVAIGPSRKGFYGSFQEFGTKHHGAQPFARPAFDANAEGSLKILAAAVWRELAAKGIMRRSSGGPVTETVAGGGRLGRGKFSMKPTRKGK